MSIKWTWSNGDTFYKSSRKEIHQSNSFQTIIRTREDLDNKISEREMIAQRGVNPFLKTNYVNDVVTRDKFLKPINTTFERIKDKDKDKD